MPVYNDWAAARQLCQLLDAEFQRLPHVSPQILMVDDGSSQLTGLWEGDYAALHAVSILRLRRNLGHQRAIAIGLAFIHTNLTADSVVVMDADGEDRPEDVPRLLAALQEKAGRAIVFAERGRRLETRVFRIGYTIYRGLHLALTGIAVRVGNFSVLPARSLDTVVILSELWNHYAAAVIKSRLPYVTVRADRGRRLSGHSKMNLVSLVIHGLSALATFAEVVTTRILVVAMVAICLLVIGIVAVIGIRLRTELAIPGWATTVTGLLALMLIQLAATGFSLVFYALSLRSNTAFLPIRDYSLFVREVETVYAR